MKPYTLRLRRWLSAQWHEARDHITSPRRKAATLTVQNPERPATPDIPRQACKALFPSNPTSPTRKPFRPWTNLDFSAPSFRKNTMVMIWDGWPTPSSTMPKRIRTPAASTMPCAFSGHTAIAPNTWWPGSIGMFPPTPWWKDPPISANGSSPWTSWDNARPTGNCEPIHLTATPFQKGDPHGINQPCSP